MPTKAQSASTAEAPRPPAARLPASTALSLESLSLVVGPPAGGIHLTASGTEPQSIRHAFLVLTAAYTQR